LRKSDFDPVSVEIFQRQLKKITLVVLVVFGVLIARLWYLQVINGSKYRMKSEHNRFHLREIPSFRGMIYDRSGRTLVRNRPCYNLYVIPEEAQDESELARRMNDLIGMDPDRIRQRLAVTSPAQRFKSVCVGRDISRDQVAVIETHRFNLPGVLVKVKPERHYVYGTLAAHLLGYLGEINEKQLASGRYPDNGPGDLVGKAGIEERWQHALQGKQGGKRVEVDAAGRWIRVISERTPVPGKSVCLTIDKDLQALAEDSLKGKKGAVVAMDPRNGQILALASSPSFDPNRFIKGIDRETWKKISSSEDFPLQNRALSGQYPPGSVFKVVVALAALQEGLIDPEEHLVCNGVYRLGRRAFRCWKKQGHGKVDLHRALRESCDVYFYKLGKRLGVDTISRYARRMGLGRITGFDKTQEKKGLIPTREWKINKFGESWQMGETLSSAIGQSFVLVTPIQMANLVSAIFNGGVLYRPKVTKWVAGADSESRYEFEPEVIGEIGIEKTHLELVQDALVGVVNEPHGTGRRARLEHVTVAGKTGTAQVVAREYGNDPDAPGEERELPPEFEDHAWFVAVAPVETPRIALAVLIEHGGHGGSVGAPIARRLIEAYIADGTPLQVAEKQEKLACSTDD